MSSGNCCGCALAAASADEEASRTGCDCTRPAAVGFVAATAAESNAVAESPFPLLEGDGVDLSAPSLICCNSAENIGGSTVAATDAAPPAGSNGAASEAASATVLPTAASQSLLLVSAPSLFCAAIVLAAAGASAAPPGRPRGGIATARRLASESDDAVAIA